MPLTKTIDLPGGRGQHFFFDIGNGDSLAFFWFPDAPEAIPGIPAPAALPTKGSFVSAHGSMNHIAINVRADIFDDYYNRLIEKGIEVTPVLKIGRASGRERGCQSVLISGEAVTIK